MKILQEKLEGFRELMITKLVRVAFKHGGLEAPTSCTGDAFNWSDSNVAVEVKAHLLEEIGEWLKFKGDHELIDIANCAFILYEMKRAGAVA